MFGADIVVSHPTRLVGGEFECCAAHEPQLRGLARAVVAQARVARYRPGDRGGEHHAAIPPRAHGRQRGLGGEKATAQVDRQHAIPLLHGCLLDQAHRVDPGVLDDDIDRSELIDRCGDGPTRIGFVRNVREYELCMAERCGQISTGRLQHVGHHDTASLANEGFGNCPANDERCTEYQDRPAREPMLYAVLLPIAH